MRRSLLIGFAAVGGALFVRHAIRGCGGFDVEKMIERMPENAPPKWMFRKHRRDPEEHGADSRATRRRTHARLE